MKFDSRTRYITLLLALIVGGGGGVLASVLTSRSLDNYAQSLLNAGRFTAISPQKVVTAPGTYEDALSRIRESSLRSVAVFLPKSSDTKSPSLFLKLESTKGAGVVVSADGWVLTTSAVFPSSLDSSQIDVWVEEKRYVIENVVRDGGTPLVLLKLKNASSLPAVGFASSGDIESGEMLFSVADIHGVAPVTLTVPDKEIAFGVQKAEVFTTEWQLSDSMKAGTPIFSSTGDLAGFSVGDTLAFPLHHSDAFVQDIVRSGSVHKVALGAYVADLSRVYNIDSTLRQGRYDGALVFAPSGISRATVLGGPADSAGIISGDILLDVDGVSITFKDTIAEVLSAYKPGEIANIRLLRAGQIVSVPVTLSDAKDLLY